MASENYGLRSYSQLECQLTFQTSLSVKGSVIYLKTELQMTFRYSRAIKIPCFYQLYILNFNIAENLSNHVLPTYL